jgi:hypothetical protein
MGYLQDQAVMNFAGTAARGSAIGTATEGMVSYLADSNLIQAYTGSSWDSLAYASSVSAIPRVGLTPIIPTSLNQSGGSASFDSTTGLITFTGTNALRANGVFTSTYNYHRIVLRIANAGSTGNYSIQGKFSASTTDSSVNYDIGAVGFLASTGGSQQLGGLNGTQFYAGRVYDSGVETMSVIDIASAAFAQYTNWTGHYIGSYPGDLQTTIIGGRHRVATAYDGFYWSSNNCTGTMKVYGYN